jgi:hypothetical protein
MIPETAEPPVTMPRPIPPGRHALTVVSATAVMFRSGTRRLDLRLRDGQGRYLGAALTITDPRRPHFALRDLPIIEALATLARQAGHDFDAPSSLAGALRGLTFTGLVSDHGFLTAVEAPEGAEALQAAPVPAKARHAV